ncbi:CPSF A subunit region-domain-containing protein [Cantharellus anzutake]|uniref:CPSF A subunit region-domain-containing protein n=1 Tax=Cantharellus anzutake TaxID=1750568 RepID=UPI00190782B9|nr:CPSF A subunit region-domain-containing protein [Cantharellus anzutake]KAF8324281.1 CPSF A subunit region-domain-containing protein [Cantharellus anzutake]
MPYAHRQEIIAANGVEFSVSLRLSPPSLDASPGSDITSIGNLVIARTNILRVYEVRQQPLMLRQNRPVALTTTGTRGRRGTEAVEGEVEMDSQGDGFVNVAEVKSVSKFEQELRPTETRLYLLREFRLHGVVTGLGKVQTLATSEDGLERLLVSFKDAKVSLLEWSDSAQDLITISIHTYERAPQLLTIPPGFVTYMRVDPLSRCAALLLPHESVAILPLYQSQVELDALEQENGIREVPYSQSFVLNLPEEVDSKIRNIADFVFLPGFNNVTLAILYQERQTWTGRINELKDTFSLSIFTLDFLTHSYPNIARVGGLPYDCFSLLACPPSYGGVLILSSNSVIHVDQTSRTTSLPVNGWASRVSSITYPPVQASLCLVLDGSRLSFIDERTALLFLSTGVVHPLTIVLDGRVVSRLQLDQSVAQCTPASSLTLVSHDHLFVGSTVGSSPLLQITSQADVPKMGEEPSQDDMDEDLDEDLYGATTYANTSKSGNGTSTTFSGNDAQKSLRLAVKDSVPGWGVIQDLAFFVDTHEARLVPDLLACTGIGGTSTITRFKSHLPSVVKRKIQTLGGNRGIWSLPVRREMRLRGSRLEQPVTLSLEDTIIVTSHATSLPGVSRVFGKSPSGDVQILSRAPGITLAAGTIFQRTNIMQVMTNSLRLLNGDGQEIDTIPESDVTSAQVSDPFILVQRKDGTVNVYSGDTAKRSLNKQPIFTLPNCLSSSLHIDRSGKWEARAVHRPQQQGTESLESILSGDKSTQWLVLHRSNDNFEIRSLLSFEVAFSSQGLSDLPSVIENFQEIAVIGTDSTQHPPNDVDKVVMATIGEVGPLTHLVVSTKSNVLILYRCVLNNAPSEGRQLLPIRFVKILSRIFHVPASSPRIPRLLIPFTVGTDDHDLHGVFISGVNPVWVVALSGSPVRVYPDSHKIVFGFSTSSAFKSRHDFLFHSDEGSTLEQWVPGVQLGAELPYESVQTERMYSKIAFHPDTQFIIAGSTLQRNFSSFDEDTNLIWQPDVPNISDPSCGASSVELISPSTWEVIDGYEFPQYEQLTALECVVLESASSPSGYKRFIVAGTAMDRGEDLATRGAVYIFEIVGVVPQTDGSGRYVLRLRCRDESKGPVTAICGINGYLVSSMGQKIFVRGFDLDERLVGVAFLDAGTYITSLRSLKNFILIGDALKGTWLAGFQEDPFKLTVLSKGRQPTPVTNADFFFGSDGQLSCLVTDEEGVIRIFEYNPRHAESNNGQLLVCRSEFHGHTDHNVIATLARRGEENDQSDQVDIESILTYGTLNGSIVMFTPAPDAVFKRLSLLQGQLIRNVQHIAGLNPRAHRMVRNDAVAKAMTRGILDGELLNVFPSLEQRLQAEMTAQIGTDRRTLLNDLVPFVQLW